MRNKILLIIAALSALAVLAVTFIVLAVTGDKDDVSSVESVNTIQVISVEKTDISEMRIKNQSGEFSFVPSNDKMVLKGREGYQLVEYMVDALTANTLGFSAYKSFPAENGDYSIYGLDNPRGTAEIIKTDGTAVTLFIGQESPTGSIYAKTSDSDMVYLADRDKGTPILRPKLEYYSTQITLGTPDSENFDSYSLVHGGQTVAIRKRTDEENAATDDILSTYVMTSPYNVSVDDVAIIGTTTEAGLISRLASLAAYSVVSDETSAETLKKYSIANPSYTVKASFGNTETVLYFSDMTDDGYYYARRGNEDLIYKVEVGMAGVLNFDALTLMSKDLYMLSITRLKSFTVSFDGASHVFNISNATTEFNEDMVVKYGDKNLPQGDFRTFYENVAAIDFNGLDPAVSGPLYLSLKYSKTDGTVDTIDFYRINDIDMCAVINGGKRFKVTKIAIDRIKSDCTDYINGKSIKRA